MATIIASIITAIAVCACLAIVMHRIDVARKERKKHTEWRKRWETVLRDTALRR